MTKLNEPIYKQLDGSYVIKVNGDDYGVCDNNPSEPYTIEMVEAYLLLHPEALIPEPVPPPPTVEELAARRVAEIKAQIAELDRQSIRPIRAKEQDRLDEIEAKVVALRNEMKGLEV